MLEPHTRPHPLRPPHDIAAHVRRRRIRRPQLQPQRVGHKGFDVRMVEPGRCCSPYRRSSFISRGQASIRIIRRRGWHHLPGPTVWDTLRRSRYPTVCSERTCSIPGTNQTPWSTCITQLYKKTERVESEGTAQKSHR